MIYLILLALTVTAALTAAFLVHKQRVHKEEIKRVITCGYVSPPASAAATARLIKMAGAATNLQVGEIKYVGKENLDNLTGPRIVTSNHPHWADAAIMPQLIGGPARYMTHGRAMSSLGGLVGLYLSQFGVFAANDSIRDGGERVRAASIQMLVNGETLMILPEGLTNFSPVMGEFKNGIAIIARSAAERLGKPVYVVPNYIRYGRYPGPWLTKFERPTQFFMVLLGFPIFRRKAVVFTGKPISTDELFTRPDGSKRTDSEAVAFLKERIAALDPGHI